MDALVKERLDNLQQRLEEHGVVDVKFHIDRSKGLPTEQKLSEDTALVLEAMLDGRCSPAGPIGDSHLHDTDGNI